MTTMTARETLIATRALIEDPAHWTIGELARDEDGDEIAPNEPEAVCWCIEGALFKTMHVNRRELGECEAWHIIRRATKELFGEDRPFAINDCLPEYGGGHPAVLRILDRAIELASD